MYSLTTVLHNKRQAMYVRRSIESRSCNRCSGKAMSITYYEFVFLTVDIQHAMCMRRILAVCGMSRYTIFLHIMSKRTWFSKRNFVELKFCVLIFSTILSKKEMFHSKRFWVRYDQRILVFMQSMRYSCQILMKLESSRQIFEKYSKYQILWKYFRWEQSCSLRKEGGRTERQDEINSRVSKFCELG